MAALISGAGSGGSRPWRLGCLAKCGEWLESVVLAILPLAHVFVRGEYGFRFTGRITCAAP